MTFQLNQNSKLAINGAKPIRTAIWKDNFTTGEEEKRVVHEVMDTGYLSLFEGSANPEAPFSFWGGPYVQKLEQDFCDYYGSPYAVSMNSATSGLYAAIGALEIGFGDEVIVSPYTMSASALAPMIYGAIPIFADVDPNTGCLCPKSVASLITPRTKAILLVHQFGLVTDMDAIMALAQKHNLKVIEDCAQSHGAKYKNHFVGTIGDIGIFSFNVNKTIQSGEGAVCLAKDADVRYRLGLIRNHGEAVVGPAGYKNITNILGFNYRLTDLQAAICIEQLKKMDRFNQTRREFVHYLVESLSKYPFLKILQASSQDFATYYVTPFDYDAKQTGLSRHDLTKALCAEGLPFAEGYVKPLYLQPIYQTKTAFKHGYPWAATENCGIKTNYVQGSCPNAEDMHFNRLLINEYIRYPHTMEDMKDIVRGFEKIFG